MKIEDKYILIEDWEHSPSLAEEISKALGNNKLNNVIISEKGDQDLLLAKELNEVLIGTNGLACVFGIDALKRFKDQKLDFILGLPTKHEAIEAVMMNILENEFLSEGS